MNTIARAINNHNKKVDSFIFMINSSFVIGDARVELAAPSFQGTEDTSPLPPIVSFFSLMM